MLSLSVAIAKNGVIGLNQKIPWHLSEDLKWFKKNTLGKKILMGRKTYESLPKHLKNRHYIVLTRNKSFKNESVDTIYSIDNAIKFVNSNEEVVVIGGAEIYRQLLPFVEKMYITKIDKTFEGDTFFPEIDYNNWNIIESKKNCTNDVEYESIIYEIKSEK